MENGDWSNWENFLSTWRDKIHWLQGAHYESAIYYERSNLWLGISVLCITTFVGSTVFTTLSDQKVDSRIKIFLGVISFIAATLSSLQTFLGLRERAEKHRTAGAAFGSLKREIDLMKNLPLAERTAPHAFAESLRERWDTLSKEAPTIPQRVWRKMGGPTPSKSAQKRGSY